VNNAGNGSKATKTSTAVFMIAFHFGHRAVDVNGHTNREHRPLIHVRGKSCVPELGKAAGAAVGDAPADNQRESSHERHGVTHRWRGGAERPRAEIGEIAWHLASDSRMDGKAASAIPMTSATCRQFLLVATTCFDTCSMSRIDGLTTEATSPPGSATGR
jgi:hypothetical protein